MATYLIANNDVTDQALFAEFVSGVVSVVEAHGGKYLARGGATQVVGGDWSPDRLVIIEFESLENAQAYVNSPEYHELAEILSRSSNTSTVLVEGL